VFFSFFLSFVIRAVEVTVSVCLRSSCNRVTAAGDLRFVRLALKVTMQNYGDSVYVIMQVRYSVKMQTTG